MTIFQQAALSPADPLATLDEDYAQAVVHIAWDRNKATGVRTLLFAWVELLPIELPAPPNDYNPRSGFRLRSASDHYLYYRHAVVAAREALQWYRGALTGNAVLPDDNGSLGATGGSCTTPLSLSPLDETPVWPTLLIRAEETDLLPFTPSWMVCPRTHHLIPKSPFDLSALWSDAEIALALPWLDDHLHFDLQEYQEYWGSAHLVAPNPIFRSCRPRLSPDGAAGDAVIIRFRQRSGRDLKGLELSLRDETGSGISGLTRIRPGCPYVQVSFGRRVGALAEEVRDDRRGLLHVGQAAHFIQSIHVSMYAARKTVVVSTSGTYDVSRSGKPEQLQVGQDAPPEPAAQRIRIGETQRLVRRAAMEQGQRWFKDQGEEARALLRGLLSAADNEVYIVDPYFTADDLVAFVPAVGRDDVPVRILTSAAVLRTSGSRGQEKGDELAAILPQMRSHKSMNPFEVRVMPGDLPDIHDRFMRIDNTIWHLGSSLNEFGSRGTMLVAVPDPAAIRVDLEEAWNEGMLFGEWFQERCQRRVTEGDPSASITLPLDNSVSTRFVRASKRVWSWVISRRWTK